MMPFTGNSGASQGSGHIVAVPPGGFAAERAARDVQRPQPVEKPHRPQFNVESIDQRTGKGRSESREDGASTALVTTGRRTTHAPADHGRDEGIGRYRSPFLAQLMAQESGANINTGARGAHNGYYRFNPTEAYEATQMRDRRIEYISFNAAPFAAAA